MHQMWQYNLQLKTRFLFTLFDFRWFSWPLICVLHFVNLLQTSRWPHNQYPYCCRCIVWLIYTVIPALSPASPVYFAWTVSLLFCVPTACSALAQRERDLFSHSLVHFTPHNLNESSLVLSITAWWMHHVQHAVIAAALWWQYKQHSHQLAYSLKVFIPNYLASNYARKKTGHSAKRCPLWCNDPLRHLHDCKSNKVRQNIFCKLRSEQKM